MDGVGRARVEHVFGTSVAYPKAGKGLRIADIKNMGRDLALEELRISHDCPVGHGDQSKFWIFRCKHVKILDKIAQDNRFPPISWFHQLTRKVMNPPK